MSFKWSGEQDLNLRPLDPQSSALPNCAITRYIAALTSHANKQPKDDTETRAEFQGLIFGFFEVCEYLGYCAYDI